MKAIDNKKLIEAFYTAFQQGDAEAMSNCYDDDVVFEDPVFGVLKGEKARNMWRMLIAGSKINPPQITFYQVLASEKSGNALWEARYIFSKTGRKVHNKIRAVFEFRNGKISRHKDDFSFWRWSSQALGFTGLVLGFTPILKNKVRKNVSHLLANFENPPK